MIAHQQSAPAGEPGPVAAVVVLAAGQGTRMRSATPKVLHTLGGRSMLGHVLAATAPLRAGATVVVVGSGREQVEAHLAGIAPAAVPVFQEAQHGSGHAAAVALAAVPDVGGPVLIVNGDAPLLREETVAALVDAHLAAGSTLTVLTAQVADPTGLGRIVRAADGRARHRRGARRHPGAARDPRDQRRRLRGRRRRPAPHSRRPRLRQRPGRAVPDRRAGDARRRGARAASRPIPTTSWAATDQREVAARRRLLNDRVLDRLMRSGVTVVDPSTTWVDVTVTVAADAVLQPGTQLQGTTSVDAGAVVGPDTTLLDCVVGRDAPSSGRTAWARRSAPTRPSGRSATCGPAPGRGAKVGRLRGDEERRDRRGLQGAAPDLRR